MSHKRHECLCIANGDIEDDTFQQQVMIQIDAPTQSKLSAQNMFGLRDFKDQIKN